MKTSSSKQRWMTAILLAVFVLIGAFIWSLPHLFQLPVIHKRIETYIARQVKGNVRFEESSLALFPKLCIRIHKVRVLAEHNFSGTIERITIYPHLPSLFRGEFNIARMVAHRPECMVTIPGLNQRPSLSVVFQYFQDHLKATMDMLNPINQTNFLLDIQHGSFVLNQDEEMVCSFQDISSRFQWKLPVLSVDIACGSELWHKGILAFQMNVATRNGVGRFDATSFKPKVVADFVFPKAPFLLDDATLDANVGWQTENFDIWDLSFEASNPDVTIRHSGDRFRVRGETISGELKTGRASSGLNISDLNLSHPKLKMTGYYERNSEKPFVGWQVDARDMDIASVKAAALFFADRFETTHKIFNVFQKGGIDRIRLGQKAQSPEAFQNLSSLYLDGHLNRATIYVPKPDLLLTESFADITVANGILEATDIQTRLDNSTGSHGRFTMVLTGPKPRPYHVEGDIRADTSQLPPLLGRLVKNRTFSKEMERVKAADGTATGRMILHRESDSFEVTVDVSEFDLDGVYDRIPFPLSVSGGGFHYSRDGVRIEDLHGNIGSSGFTGLTAATSWQLSPKLTVSSARADIAVDEVVSWLDARPASSTILKNIESGRGRLSLDSFRFEGPIDMPPDWRFQAKAHVTDALTLCIPLFPESMTFHSGEFSITQDRIDFSSHDLSVLDAYVRATGALTGYSTENRRLEAQIDGNLGRDICDWIFTQTRIPKVFQWRAPLAVSPVTVNWHENDNLNVSGKAVFESGARMMLDVQQTSETIAVKELNLQDEYSRTAATLTFDNKSAEVGFSGSLDSSTLDLLLVENNLLIGSITGDFRMRYDVRNPFRSTLAGRLISNGLDMTAFGIPLKIKDMSLTADGSSAQISSARFTWEKSDFASSGRIEQGKDGFLLDLILNSKVLHWPEVKSLLKIDKANVYSSPANLFGTVRLTCDTFILGSAVTFQPLEAEFRLDGHRTDIVFHQADACGISFPGTITLTSERTLLSFEPFASQKPLETTMACLREGKTFMDGLFDLSGKLAFQLNSSSSIAESLDGEAALTAKNGRIYRAVLLGKLFSLLNIGEMLSGKFPDFEKEGFPYETCLFEGRFRDGLFELETGVVDSAGMKIFYEGSEDLINKQHDLTLVVAPLKTVDAVVEKIPLVNEVLEKGAVIYPVKVTGSWDKPQLTLLSPTGVGNEVWGIMLRTLRLPVTLLEAIIQNGDKK